MNKPVEKGIQELIVESVDGNAVYCFLQKPEGDGPFPAVIFIHGGLGDDPKYTRAMLDWSIVELLLQEGFAVFSTDYRVDLTGKDIGDVVAVFKYVTELPYVDGQKIAYFGDSHGAYIAIMAAIQTNPYALIHGWGVADMADWYKHIKTLPASYYQRVCEDFEQSLGGTPDQAPEAYRLISPTAHVANINCPVLVLHGEEDKEVPISHAHKLAQAIASVNGDFELKIFKSAGHGLRSPDFRMEMDPLVLEFLKKNLSK